MGGSLNEAERPEQSPATASQVRPVTLSVVIDGRLDAARGRQVATLTHRLGLAGAWLRYPWWPTGGSAMSEPDVAGLLAALASGPQVPLGLVVDAGPADLDGADADRIVRLVMAAGSPAAGSPAAGSLAGGSPATGSPAAGSLGGGSSAGGSPAGGSLAGGSPAGGSSAGGLSAGPRIAFAGPRTAVAQWQGMIGQQPGMAVPWLALPVGTGAEAGAAAVFVPCAPSRDLAGEVSAAAAIADGRPVLAEVTVSVGRTAAEARARADADELFTLAGHPAEQGLFGTLEECQAAAARLAQAGATELVCYLPLASDLPDVLAQLRSIAIGAGVLRPGEPPSAPPRPPDGWGGRRLTA